MSSLSRSIGLAVTASALVLLTACGGGGSTESAPATVVADPVVTFPPLTRTSSAPTTEAPAPETATVVVTKTVQGEAVQAQTAYVDPELFRSVGSQSLRDYRFNSPTGNVQCSVSADGSPDDAVACQATETVAPSDGTACTPPDRPTRIVARAYAVATQCQRPGDSSGSPDSRVLQYGQVLRIGGVECSSSEVDGIRCTTGQIGFQLSRDVNRVF